VDKDALSSQAVAVWALGIGHWALSIDRYTMPMPLPFEEFDLSGVRTYPLASRRSKSRAEDFARPVAPGASFHDWFTSLPAILAGADVHRVVDALRAAREREAAIVWGIGAHVIKTGVSPVLIDLMARGYVSAMAMNGAGLNV